MKNNSLIKEYSKAASEWDQWYAELHGLYITKSIRVEQGEYAVVSNSETLGTYNVRQCVVVYLATKLMHGLAHVDGHTEIKSLKAYLNALNTTEENPLTHIKIIGASSNMVMGLNNSKKNIEKIILFLNSLGDKVNINALIQEKGSFIDFIIKYPGEICDHHLPAGTYNTEQALHTIQEIKRINKYSGTYPIIRANDGHSKSVFLDERAIIKLTEYIKNIDKDKIRSEFDTNNYKPFDTAIPVILEEWKKSVSIISTSFKVDTICPLFIGEDSIVLNNKSLLQHKLYINSANINVVLEYCYNIDNSLDIVEIKSILKGQYKGNFDYSILEYDAVINASSLLTIIFSRSSLLNKLIILNSQGACDLNGKLYKIQDIKSVLNKEELLTLEEIIDTHNQKLLNTKGDIISKEQFNQFVNIQFQSREKSLSRKEKILLDQQRKNIQDLCNQHLLEFNQVNQSINRRCKEYQDIQREKNKITDQSNFLCIQSELLERLKLPNFSDISIGTYLSNYADDASYVFDIDFGKKISAIIGSFASYFDNKIKEESNIESYDNHIDPNVLKVIGKDYEGGNIFDDLYC